MSKISELEDQFILDALKDKESRVAYIKACVENRRHIVTSTVLLSLATIGLVTLAWIVTAIAFNGLTEFDVGWGIGMALTLIVTIITDSVTLCNKRKERIARSI